MADKKSEPSFLSLSRNTWIILIAIVFFVILIVPFLGGLDAVKKLIMDNLVYLVALAGAIYYLINLKKKSEVWEGPGGLELLMYALAVCPEFKYTGVTFESIPKSMNELQFIHDRKREFYIYYMQFSHADNIRHKVVIAYNPRKPNDWAPKVKEMRGLDPVDLDEASRQGGKVQYVGDAVPDSEQNDEEEGNLI